MKKEEGVSFCRASKRVLLLSLLHEHASGFGTLHVQLAGVLRDSTETAAPDGEDIANQRTFEAILFSNLATNAHSAAETTADNGNQVTETALVLFNSSLLEGDLARAAAP